MQEQYTFLTPENVELRYPTAGAGSRLIAAGIDYLILTLAQTGIFIGLVGGLPRLLPSLGIGPPPDVIVGIATLAASSIWLMLWTGYFIVFELVWHGQTPGKRLTRLRVIRSDGQPVGLLASLVRNMLRNVDLLLGIGLLVMMLNRSSRRLGDLAAGTLVVREIRLGVSAFAPAPIPEVPVPLVDALPNAGRLTGEHYSLVRDYFTRRARLRPEETRDVAQALAGRFHRLLELPAPLAEDPDVFLATIARAIEARQAYRE